MYATDRRTDKSNAYCSLYGRGIIMKTALDDVDSSKFCANSCHIIFSIRRAVYKRCDYMNIYKMLLFPQT